MNAWSQGLSEGVTHLANVIPEALHAVAPQDEPNFEGAETPAEPEVPVAVVDDKSCLEVSFACLLRRRISGLPASCCLVRRNSGVTSSASVRSSLFLTHSIDASKLTSPHCRSLV